MVETNDHSACAWTHADRWLAVDEICKYFGVSKNTVYKWISEKGMPSHNIGRFGKFKKDEVDTWVRYGKASDSKEGEDQ